MASKSGSVDPSKFPDEVFDLYSIPAFDSSRPEVVAGRAIGSAKQIVRPGDVLLSRIVPHIRRAWVVANERGRRIIASGEWIVFRSNRVHPDYLRHVLVGDPFHAQFMNTVAGVGGSLLRARPEHVAKIKIPLPSLAEQRRIAAVLDWAEALRTKRRAVLARFGVLTQSVFLDLVGDPGTNPKCWSSVAVGNVAGIIVPTRDKPKRFVGDIPWVTLPDLHGLFVSKSQSALTIQDASEVGNRLIPANSVLLSCAGTLGRVAVTTTAVYANQQFYGLIPQTDIIDVIFLAFCLLLKGEAFFARLGGSFTIGFFSKQKALEIQIPLPPLSLQREFSRRITAVEKLKSAHCASLATLDTMFSCLQHQAFRGEL
jgi:type I restriction enzyme, S subunit